MRCLVICIVDVSKLKFKGNDTLSHLQLTRNIVIFDRALCFSSLFLNSVSIYPDLGLLGIQGCTKCSSHGMVCAWVCRPKSTFMNTSQQRTHIPGLSHPFFGMGPRPMEL